MLRPSRLVVSTGIAARRPDQAALVPTVPQRDADSGITGIIAVMDDVTDRRRLEASREEQRARLAALRRAVAVAVRIEIVDDRTSLRLFMDGNGNGVLQKDIDKGLDPPLSPLHWVDEQARDVSLRINQAILDAGGSGTLEAGDDPLRIGNSALLTFSPLGSATSGTLYVAAEGGPQMAIRVFGATGRVRVLMFDAQTRQWHP